MIFFHIEKRENLNRHSSEGAKLNFHSSKDGSDEDCSNSSVNYGEEGGGGGGNIRRLYIDLVFEMVGQFCMEVLLYLNRISYFRNATKNAHKI